MLVEMVVCVIFGLAAGSLLHFLISESLEQCKARQRRKHREQRIRDQQTNIGNRIFNDLTASQPEFVLSTNVGRTGVEPYRIVAAIPSLPKKTRVEIEVSMFCTSERQIQVFSEIVEFAQFSAVNYKSAMDYIQNKMSGLKKHYRRG